MSSLLPIRFLMVVSLLVLSQAAPAQHGAGTPEDTLRNLQTSLKIIENALNQRRITESEIGSIRQQIEYISETSLRIRTRAMQEAEEQKKLLEALGPKPADSEPSESERIVEERNELQDAIARHQGRIQSANVILARVDTLRARMVQEELGVLTRVLSQYRDTPLSPDVIGNAFSNLPERLDAFGGKLSKWWRDVTFDRERFGTLAWWLVLLVVALAVVPTARRWVLYRFGPDRRDEKPSFTRRFRVTLAVGLSNVVMPVVAIVGVYIVLLKSAAMTPAVEDMAWVLMLSICQFFVIAGLSSAAMSPKFPVWRLSRLSDASATRLHRSIRLFAALTVVMNLIWLPLSGEEVAHQFADVMVLDVARGAATTLFGALSVVVMSAAMLNILRRDNWMFVSEDEDGNEITAPPNKVVRVFFSAARVGLVAGIAAALIGYVNLALFLAQRVVWCLLLVALAYLSRTFIAGAFRQIVGGESDTSSMLRDSLGYSKSGAERLLFWVMLLVDVLLVIGVVVFLMLIWGVHISSIQATASKLIYGVNIGSYTLSLMDVGVALGIFIVLFIAVRLFQSFLSNRILAQTVPDVGVRDALTTGVGYAGIIIAAFVAISSLGLELSQLAIIFGALSVGIGFGLQHVVSNFISGLILLMHRPIKAGDWIVVGQYEGYVKKVNVVATEIQTFDNAEVIVPNSQLVSSEVLNWTHKSTVARVIVAVGVSYDSDPERVREVLMACVSGRDDVLSIPAPVVIFRDFGESALRFELRFFIRQADYMLFTASELRFSIVEAFRKAGITIPFPQRDIHIKTPGSPGADGEEEFGGESGGRGGRRRRQESEPDKTADDADTD